MKPILFWELKQRKSYFVWWTVITIGLISLLLLIYPSIHSQANQINKVLNQLPAALRSLKTGGSNVDISSPIGYLNSQLYYLTLPLVQIIMSIGLGSSLLANEEQNHTLELLLARPISRAKILAVKALTGIILMLGVSLIASMATLWLAKIVNMNISSFHLILASFYCFLFSLSFGAIAFTFSAASTATRRLSVAIAVFISFGGYLLATLGSLTHSIEGVSKLLPYYYYNPTHILEGHVAAGLNTYLVLVFIISSFASWLGFRRRDIN